MKTTFFIGILCTFLATAGISAAASKTGGDYRPRLDKDGWEILFDGKGLDAWNVAPGQSVWAVNAQGELYPAKAGPYLSSRRRYCDFIVEADFKLGAKAKANSGVFVRVHDAKRPVETGMEVQILDDGDYNVPWNAMNACGALYDLVPPSIDVNRPVGQWNHFRITVDKALVRVEMNGKEIVTADLDRWTTAGKNPNGQHNKFPYAIAAMPREGFLQLQNYGGAPVWFRNIRIKPLSDRQPQYTGNEPMEKVLAKPAKR